MNSPWPMVYQAIFSVLPTQGKWYTMLSLGWRCFSILWSTHSCLWHAHYCVWCQESCRCAWKRLAPSTSLFQSTVHRYWGGYLLSCWIECKSVGPFNSVVALTAASYWDIKLPNVTTQKSWYPQRTARWPFIPELPQLLDSSIGRWLDAPDTNFFFFFFADT